MEEQQSEQLKCSIIKRAFPSNKKNSTETKDKKKKTEKIMKIEGLEVNLDKVCIDMEMNKKRSYAQYITIENFLPELRIACPPKDDKRGKSQIDKSKKVKSSEDKNNIEKKKKKWQKK